MGEYAYFGDRKVKLGTCEDLTYITHAELRQAHAARAVHTAPGNAEIDQYLDPANGYRFRFPFTDERCVLSELGERVAVRPTRYLEIELVGMENDKLYRSMMAHKKINPELMGEDGSTYTLLDLHCPLSNEPGRPRMYNLMSGPMYTPKFLVCGEKPMPDGTVHTVFCCPVCGAMFRLSESEIKLVRNCVRLLLRKEFGAGVDEPSLIPTKKFARYADLVYLAQNMRGEPDPE